MGKLESGVASGASSPSALPEGVGKLGDDVPPPYDAPTYEDNRESRQLG